MIDCTILNLFISKRCDKLMPMKDGIKMAKTKYIIQLTESERKLLEKIISEGNESERTILRAKILLISDVSNGKKLSLLKTAEELGTTHTTVQTVRGEYAQGGVDKTVYRKERAVSTATRKINDDVIEKIRLKTLETPPEGHKKWSSRLLCKVCMEEGIFSEIAPTTMLRILRKIENKK